MPRRLQGKNKQMKGKLRRFSGGRYESFTVFQSPPVKEGQELDVLIDDVGSRGDGVSRIGGYLIFVPGAKIGERVRVKILQVSSRFAVAEKA